MSSSRLIHFLLLLVFASCFTQTACRPSARLEESLALAAGSGNIQQMKQLLSKGVNINSRTSIRGHTPLTFAIEERNLISVQFLLNSGADPNLCDGRGFSPLQLAIFNSDDSSGSIIESLVQAGANTDTVTNIVQNLPENDPNRDVFDRLLRESRRGQGVRSSARH